MDSPQRSLIIPGADGQGSSFFDFLCNLSPIKPVKSSHLLHTFNEFNFPPPPPVFVSPRADVHKESSFFKRSQLRSDCEIHQRLGVERNEEEDYNSFDSPCSSPSKIVDEYLAVPKEYDESGDDASPSTFDSPNTSTQDSKSVSEANDPDSPPILTVSKSNHPDELQLATHGVESALLNNIFIKKEIDRSDLYIGFNSSNYFLLTAGMGHSHVRLDDWQNEVSSTISQLSDEGVSVMNEHHVAALGTSVELATIHGESDKEAEQLYTNAGSTLSPFTAWDVESNILHSRSSAHVPSGIGLHLNSLTECMLRVHSKESSVHTTQGVSSSQEIPSGNTDSSFFQETMSGCLPPGTATGMEDHKVKSEIPENDMLGVLQDNDYSVGSDKKQNPLGKKRIFLQDVSHENESVKIEELAQSVCSPKKKRRSSSGLEKSGEGCKRCHCKKSKCLKLYCECFAAGVYCLDSCNCQGCFNKPEFEATVMETRQQIESRNPLAFAPKIIRGNKTSPAKREEIHDPTASARHKKGCNCKKSHCLKKYCECYQAGVGCSDTCKCNNCKNFYGTKEAAEASEEKDLRNESADNETLNEDIGTSDFSDHHDTVGINATHSLQDTEEEKGPTNDCKRHLCPEQQQSFAFVTSKSLLVSSTGVEKCDTFSKTDVSPISTPKALKTGCWDGVDDVCALPSFLQIPMPTPTSVLDGIESPPPFDGQKNDGGSNSAMQISNQLRKMSSAFPTTEKPCYKLEPDNFGHQLDDPMEEDSTPEFLKECTFNMSSPRSKRILPPDYHGLGEVPKRPSISHRSYILQSVPSISFPDLQDPGNKSTN